MSELFPFAVEHLLSEAEAKKVTEPHWGDLSSVWVSAITEWHSFSEEHRARLSSTPFVPPIVVFGFAQSFAREKFSNRDDDGIILCEGLGVFAFYIERKVLIRFNALARDHIVRQGYQSSDRKELYFRQEPIDGLNNDATRLTAGYLMNEAKTDLASVAISCQVGENLVYTFPIDGSNDSLLPLPTPQTSPSPASAAKPLRKRKPR
ncbi:MAG TPA: hypothetical protein VGN12_18040 [Pirellulales bacterium]|jgi:hypothetical protein